MDTGRTFNMKWVDDPSPQARAHHDQAHDSIMRVGPNPDDLETLRVTWYRACWRCPGSRN